MKLEVKKYSLCNSKATYCQQDPPGLRTRDRAKLRLRNLTFTLQTRGDILTKIESEE